MELLIISGLSGSGKSRAAAILEDMNFYCVDNMPIALMPKFAEMCLATRGRYEKVALVADIRTTDRTQDILDAIDEMNNMGCNCRVLFCEADIKTIVRRYKETRRRHPIQAPDIETSVRREVELFAPLRDRADVIVNTTDLSVAALQRKLKQFFATGNDGEKINLSIVSFGYKYGLPIEADIVFDVRFMANPFYIPELRDKTGVDQEVSDFVFAHDETVKFFREMTDLLELTLPYYHEEGRPVLTVCFGCTGGRHRSVAVAHVAAEYFAGMGYNVECIDRDINK